MKPLELDEVKDDDFKWRTKKLAHLAIYTDPKRKRQILANGTKANPNAPIDTKVLENFEK